MSTTPRFPESPNEITQEIPIVQGPWLTRHTAAPAGVGPRRPSRYPRNFKIFNGMVTGVMTLLLWLALLAHPPVWFLPLAWPIVIVGWILIIADSIHVHPAEWRLVTESIFWSFAIYLARRILRHWENEHTQRLATAIVDAQHKAGM